MIDFIYAKYATGDTHSFLNADSLVEGGDPVEVCSAWRLLLPCGPGVCCHGLGYSSVPACPSRPWLFLCPERHSPNQRNCVI